MNIGLLFITIFINPITNVLIGLYHLLLLGHIPYPLGFAVILMTVLIRLILYPFVSAQIKSAHKMQKVTPHLAAVKEKHKDDKKRQQEEIMKLYKEHGINPAAGCLPLVIQLPVIWSLYSVLTHVVNVNTSSGITALNKILYFPWMHISQNTWNVYFFGAVLSSSPSKMFSANPAVILIPVVTGVLQFFLSKMMLPEPSLVPTIAKGEKKKDDFQTAFQNQSLFIFPVMIAYFSFSLPLGLSLYWNTFTIFGILQQYLLVGAGGTKPWLSKIGINAR
ncbi:MAG: YidC/Oxa1 family membrane protein insertase [Candidatus Levyibacteriota bacterium]